MLLLLYTSEHTICVYIYIYTDSLAMAPKYQTQKNLLGMEWSRGQIIGRGSSATVSLATITKSGHAFAVKSAEVSQSEILQREQSIISTLNCPQIIAHEGHDITCEDGQLLYNLFLEYAPGGSVVDAIRRHGGQLEEAVIRSYTSRILLGLDYLHSNGIVHCDIKCRNILVTADGAKIADFGCARLVKGMLHHENTPISGTPAYMAPEVARGEHQSFPADVWALGCSVIEMATGRAPWANNVSDPVSALYQIGFSPMLPEIPGSMSEQAHDFLSKCLKRDPTERWSTRELLNHAFIVEEPNANCYSTRGSNGATPTSILDHTLWDTSEPGTRLDSTHQTNSLVSPIERIQQLTGKMPNWEWDDTWVVVRSSTSGSKEQETTSSFLCHGLDKTCYGEDDSACAGPENVLTVPNETIGCSGVDPFGDGSSGTCNHKVILIPCICEKDASCRSFNFDKETAICSLQIAFCISLIFCLIHFLVCKFNVLSLKMSLNLYMHVYHRSRGVFL